MDRWTLDKQRLGQLIDLVSNIKVGDADSRAKDVLGRVYEYFLSQFASAEGKKGGEFYTPRCVVKLLVEMLEPYQGRLAIFLFHPPLEADSSKYPQFAEQKLADNITPLFISIDELVHEIT